MVMIRRLAPSELYYLRSAPWVSYTTVVSGPIHVAALEAAGAALQCAYPVLGLDICADEQGRLALFQSAYQSGEAAFVAQRGETDAAVIDELGNRTGAVRVLRGKDGTTAVTLTTNHAVADARHSLQLLAELWLIYTDVVNGETPRIAGHRYPRPLEALLIERGVAAKTAAAVAGWEPIPSTNRESRYRRHTTQRIRLSATETSAFVAAARREQTTVNGVVSAALLQASSAVFGVRLPEVLYRYPVDLRKHLSPKVGFTEGTNMLDQTNYTPGTDCYPDLFTLARDVTRVLRLRLAQGQMLRSWTEVPRHSALVVSSNWGIVPNFVTPQENTILDFYPGFIDAHSASYDLPVSMTTITTFDGQLTLDTTSTAAAHCHALACIMHALS